MRHRRRRRARSGRQEPPDGKGFSNPEAGRKPLKVRRKLTGRLGSLAGRRPGGSVGVAAPFGPLMDAGTGVAAPMPATSRRLEKT